MTAAGNESRRVLYSGRVQGVGFRYTARRISQGHAVTGFVRNLDDGRVEFVVEGPPEELDRVLAEVSAAMSGYIREAPVQKGAATGKYSSFEVAY
jgi:acylphosphatase